MHNLSILCTTTATKKEAKHLATLLLKANLAACVQIHKVKSHYIWENKLCEEKEFRLLIKTLPSCLEHAKALIIANHSYKLPQILVIKAESSKDYLQYVTNCVESS